MEVLIGAMAAALANVFGFGQVWEAFLNLRGKGRRQLLVGELAKTDGEESAKIERILRELKELDTTVPFQREAARVKAVSWGAFAFGSVVVVAVILVGVREWLALEDPVEISTGTGLARAGVVFAAFYLAGQLFKRSTVLQLQAQEFERSAISISAAAVLSDDLSPGDRSAFLRSVYESNLGVEIAKEAKKEQETSKDVDPLKLLESIQSLREPS